MVGFGVLGSILGSHLAVYFKSMACISAGPPTMRGQIPLHAERTSNAIPSSLGRVDFSVGSNLCMSIMLDSVFNQRPLSALAKKRERQS